MCKKLGQTHSYKVVSHMWDPAVSENFSLVADKIRARSSDKSFVKGTVKAMVRSSYCRPIWRSQLNKGLNPITYGGEGVWPRPSDY